MGSSNVFLIPNLTHILVLSKQDLIIVHVRRFQQEAWWLLVLCDQIRSLKTAAWSSQEGVEICSNFLLMYMNRKHHVFWITNGVRHWSYRLLPSDYAQEESFSPSFSQTPWRKCDVHSTASLKVNKQVFRPRRRINNFCLILTLFFFFFFFFFFQFQPKATRAGDEKQTKKTHGLTTPVDFKVELLSLVARSRKI